MSKDLKRIVIALENTVMQLRRLSDRHDQWCREVVDLLADAKDSSGSLRSGQPEAAPDGQEGGEPR